MQSNLRKLLEPFLPSLVFRNLYGDIKEDRLQKQTHIFLNNLV